LELAKAAISPGEVGWSAAANATTWCCWRMSGRPFALSNGTYGSPRMTRELLDPRTPEPDAFAPRRKPDRLSTA